MRVLKNIGRVFVGFLDRILSSRYLVYISLIASVVTCIFFISKYVGKDRDNDVMVSELTIKINKVKEINNHKILDYVDTLSHVEHKKFISIEDSLLLYVVNLDEFLYYDKRTENYPNDSMDYYIQYSKKAISLFDSKINMLNEILLTYNDIISDDIPPFYSQENTSMLIYKMNSWLKCAEDDYKIIDSIERSNGDKQDTNKTILKIIYNIFRSKEYYEVELSFLDYVLDYDEKVKSMLVKESEK